MSRSCKRLSILALLIFLSACATSPRPTLETAQPQSWEQHLQQVSNLEQWVLSARVTVNTQDKAWSGKVLWRQQAEDFQIHFNAPFGQGAFRLEGGPGSVEMHLSDGQVFRAPDAETLIYQQLGWRFPLQGLRYWVMGVPQPQSPTVLGFHESGVLSTLTQAHWQIRYPAYVQVDEVLLPRKVYLENTELKVRLVVDRWELLQELDSGA